MITSPKYLYVIGNGFDIHHDINSKYADFAKWLEDNHPDVAIHFDEVYGDCDSDWWNDFENQLASLEAITYSTSIASQNQPDLMSEHCDRTWEDAAYAVQDELTSLYMDLRVCFHDWILSLNKPHEEKRLTLSIKDAVFLNFNYTTTLEEMYGVDYRNILHIHGCKDTDEEFILGHGKSLEELEEANKEVPNTIPDDLTDEERCEWYEEQEGLELHEQYALQEALSGIASQRKPVKDIINKNRSFFENLQNVEIVYILGMSLSEVDKPYLATIISEAKSAEYIFSIHTKNDEEKVTKLVAEYKIKRYKIIHLEDLLDKQQLMLNFD